MSCNLFAASKRKGIQPVVYGAISTIQPPSIKSITHVIRKGETLSSIAGKYKDVSYQEIAKANGIHNSNNIYVGQRITIPNQPKAPTPPPVQPTHTPLADSTSIGGSKGSGCECNIDIEYFFQNCKFSGKRKESIKKILQSIQEYYNNKNKKCNLKQIAYMLATTKHETAKTFKPITEYGGRKYFNRYDPVLANTASRRAKARKMENTQKDDGYKYRGRGFVQLTWKKNYRKAGNFLGIDLVNHPELALDQKNAAKIMIYGMEKGIFTGKKLSDYINSSKTDYYNARKIINGHDKASTIEVYAKNFEKCLRLKK